MVDLRKTYDTIIVGSGATGGWAAMELTQRGLDVLVLEAGSQLDNREPDKTNTPADPEAWRARKQVASRHPSCHPDTQHLFVDEIQHPYVTPSDKPFDWIRIRHVGGRTLLWGRVSLRMGDLDFKAASRDGFGDDWPIAYADIAPYYDRVEQFYGVMGTKEGLVQVPDGKFCGASEMTIGERAFKAAVEKRWSDRRVIINRGMPIQTKAELSSTWETFTSLGSTLALAQKTGRLSIRPDAIVNQILTDPASGKARAVSFIDRQTREEHVVSGKVIVLCASTIESIRIMLRSTSGRHPQGLGNSSGLLGHYLMDHTRAALWGIAPQLSRKDLGAAFGGPNSIYVPRFRNVTDRHPDFVRGYGVFGGIQRRDLDGIGDANSVPFVFSIHGEHIPTVDDRVTLDPEAKDDWGLSAPRIECKFRANEQKLAADAVHNVREMIAEAGFEILEQYDTLSNPGWMMHEVGGARMGSDREKSVLNAFNQSWDCPNLFVTDGACWVSCGCQNVTLTMLALTARACDYIVSARRDGKL